MSFLGRVGGWLVAGARPVHALGDVLTRMATHTGETVALVLAVGTRLHHLPRRFRVTCDLGFILGIRVLHVVVLVGLFAGMVLALQTGIELTRIGQESSIGTIVALALAREMGPFVTAIVVAAAMGSSIAATLGTMAVSDELTALDAMNVDRISYLVLPRVVALAFLTPLLTLVTDAVGVVGGGIVAQAQLDVSWPKYWDTVIEALRRPGELLPLPKDLYGGLVKSVWFGVLIAGVSCGTGLRARGGAEGVGRAVRNAVRDSVILVIVTGYFLDWALYR